MNSQFEIGDFKMQPDEIIERIHAVQSVCRILDTLTPREASVLIARFGIGGGAKPMSRQQIADQWNVTLERIRQIEAKAFRKSRHPSRAKIYLGK